MPAYTKEQGGAAILKDIRELLHGAPSAIRSTAARDDFPVEHRRRKRTETVTAIREMARDAATAFRLWADEKEAAAKAALRANPVGSDAEETRKLRNEMEFDRLVAAATRSGTPRNLAKQYAADAEQAFLASDYERAVVLARAASAVAPSDAAARVRAMAQEQIDLADPAKAAAHREVAEVAWARKVFDRDLAAGLADLLSATADAARAVGDDPSALLREASQFSLMAKGLAALMAEETGTPYEPPRGALASDASLAADQSVGDAVRGRTRPTSALVLDTTGASGGLVEAR